PLVARAAPSVHGAIRVSSRSTVAISRRTPVVRSFHFRAISPLASPRGASQLALPRSARASRSSRTAGSSGAARLALQLHVDAEVRADLVAEHAADAVALVGDDHRKPAELVWRRPPREDVGRAHVETEPARLAELFADDDVPLAGGPAGGLLLRLEQRHPTLPAR